MDSQNLPIEKLSFDDCWELLADDTLGRLAVVVDGHPEVMQDQADKDAVDSLGLEPWQPGEKGYYIRLNARAMTGRRFEVAKPDIWNTRVQDRRRASFE